MRGRSPGPGMLAAAAVVIGGILVIVLPRHAPAIVRLVVVTVAAAAALHVLAVQAPPAWWTSPFDRSIRRDREPVRSGELEGLRSRLAGRRQRIEGAPPMPVGTLHLLKPLIRAALERRGFDPAGEPGREAARRAVSPLTWTMLTHEPLRRPGWLRTRRPDASQVARVVQRVLDDLDRLGRDPGGSPPPYRNPGAT